MRIRAEEVVHVLPHAEGWALAPSPTGQPFAVFLNRQFAIRAGQAMAVRSGRELVVHGHDGAVEVVVGAAESRRMLRKPLLGRRRGRPRAMRPERPDQASVTCLLDVRIAYDSWCLRVVRTSTERALAEICPRALLDEIQTVVTELVLQTALRSRQDCRLTMHLLDAELAIEVRSGPSTRAPDGSPAVEPAVGWAQFDLRHGVGDG